LAFSWLQFSPGFPDPFEIYSTSAP